MSERQFFGHVIDGQEVQSVDGATLRGVEPVDAAGVGRGGRGGPEDAARAVASSRRAFDEGPWPRMGRVERGAAIHRLADVMEARADDLATLDTRNMGKPFAQARHDVGRSVWNFRFFADHQRDHCGEVYPMDSGHHSYSEYGPAGVVAAVSPWNFPLMMATWKVAPAIAWGNTCVIKPSEDTPASVTLLGRLAVEAGLPPGVINVLNGHGSPAGSSLMADDRVDRVTFTGSSTTARHVMASAAGHLAPVSPRARRQGRQHRVRRRRPRQRRPLGGGGDLPQLRPGLPRGIAAVRGRRDLRRVHGAVRRGGRGADDR